jgi:hypothetical protein
MSPGRGGVSRGRGDAPLDYENEAPEAQEFKAQKLASHVKPSRDWTLVGVTRAEPRTAPIENAGPGGAAAAGDGGAAWRTRLAPRHRDAVKRYFTTGNQGK